MGNKILKIEEVSIVDLSDYIDFHKVDLDLDNRKFSIFVGRKPTDLGIDILSGHDLLGFFESEGNLFKELGNLITKKAK